MVTWEKTSMLAEQVQTVFPSDEPVPQAVAADLHDEAAVAAALADARGVVNAVSLYVEHGRESFDAVYVEGAARLARRAREAGVEQLVHVSGIGADPAAAAPYIRAHGRPIFQPVAHRPNRKFLICLNFRKGY
jgi:uncharacterized protein YbjT (DUF2867 family)